MYRLPWNGPLELSTAMDGKLWTRSFPGTWSMVRYAAGATFTGAPNVAPLSVDRANPTLLVQVPIDRCHAMYTSLDPAAKRGTGASLSNAVALTMVRRDQVGGVPVRMSSE